MKKFLKTFLGAWMMTLGPALACVAGYAANWPLMIVAVVLAATVGAAGLIIIENNTKEN